MSESQDGTELGAGQRTIGEELSEERLFELLSADRRRQVLAYLFESGRAATLDELTTAVAAAEGESPPTELSAATTRKVGIALHHVHLPKLDDAGLVDYEPDDKVTMLTVDVTVLSPYL